MNTVQRNEHGDTFERQSPPPRRSEPDSPGGGFGEAGISAALAIFIAVMLVVIGFQIAAVVAHGWRVLLALATTSLLAFVAGWWLDGPGRSHRRRTGYEAMRKHRRR